MGATGISGCHCSPSDKNDNKLEFLFNCNVVACLDFFSNFAHCPLAMAAPVLLVLIKYVQVLHFPTFSITE